MLNILDEIIKQLPEGKISDSVFEGANIVLYTKDKEFFRNSDHLIKKVVNDIKKRVELRADPSITLPAEESKRIIKETLPEEAEVGSIFFEPQRSLVTIEADKPGVAIGKQGSLFRELRNKIMWTPIIKRKPAIESRLINNIRTILYLNSDFRRKFLNRVGHRVYDGWMRGRREEWVRVSYLGSARQVGRSSILLQTPESRVLLDCGLDVSASNNDVYPHFEAPEFNINDLDAVIISHAHMDHIGMVPYLFKYGYDGPVYCTEPTRDISALSLLDFVKIMRTEWKEPLFDEENVKDMIKHTITLNYDEVTDITPDVRITLYNAGHILGSSMVHIHVGNGLHNILYTGDFKYGRTELLNPAVTEFPRLESLMMESTYGGRDNILPPRKQSEEDLKNAIAETLKSKGKVLIPVLGTGRAQEIMLLIERFIRNGELEKVPVFVDGIVWDITAIHTAYPDFLNNSVRKLIFRKDQNPFLSDIFHRVGSSKERKKVIEETGSCIILATSGMLVGGPSVEYLRQLSEGKNNSLIFVSYQGEGTLGRRIQRGEREFVLGKEIVKVNMSVFTIEGLTGHSGRKQLMQFVYKCNPRPKRILINHGENSRCLDLASSLHKSFRVETLAPRNLDAVRLR